MRHAVVTGGESGIGAATVIRLREDGVKVTTLDLAPSADLVVDVTDGAAVAAAIAEIGAVDILVNSAGFVGAVVPLWQGSDEDWSKSFRINVDGVRHTCRAVLPGMIERGWGRIVNLASMAGKDGNPNQTAYAASKAAVIGLTKSLGKELATTGVLVNAIAPAVIETPMQAGMSQDHIQRLAGMIPMGRLGRPQEVAELIAWLTSDRVSFSTGAVYDISGGRATY